jgi:hypothetical protein
MAKTDHYDVALSFAGEDRKFAEELFTALHQRGISVFYDNNEKADLWGKNLYDYLSDLYLNRAKYCVMLISRHYVQKMWTNHERQAAQARAVKEKEEYILPIKLDNSDISGLTHSIAFITWPPETAKTIADKIEYKLGIEKSSSSLSSESSLNNGRIEKVGFWKNFSTAYITLFGIGLILFMVIFLIYKYQMTPDPPNEGVLISPTPIPTASQQIVPQTTPTVAASASPVTTPTKPSLITPEPSPSVSPNSLRSFPLKDRDVIRLLSDCNCNCKGKYYLGYDEVSGKAILTNQGTKNSSYWIVKYSSPNILRLTNKESQGTLNLRNYNTSEAVFETIKVDVGLDWEIGYLIDNNITLKIRTPGLEERYLDLEGYKCDKLQLSDKTGYAQTGTWWKVLFN